MPSNAGCGLTNGPDGKLYSNTSGGVAVLDASTGAAVSMGGQAGNALGIAYDPATRRLVYPDQACRFTSVGCPIDTYDPASGASTTLLTIPASQATFIDGVAFDPSGRFLLLSTRYPVFALTVVDTQTARIVQQVPIGSEPDGISVHWSSPQFVVTNNNDGTMTRFDFAGGDLTTTPTVSTFASGGFRGDLSLVGSDGCAYVTQGGTRFADGSTSGTNSIVRMCPGFTPSTGVAPPASPASILFVHGVSEASTENVFSSLFDKVTAAAPGASLRRFEFFQDKTARLPDGTCLPSDPGQQLVPAPSNWAGMPYDASQNTQTSCDSAGDIGQSSISLGNEVKHLHDSSGKKVILVGYSMGGETIRAFLAHSTAAGDGIAATMVDSVVTMYGVQQGSWIASGAKYLQGSWAGPINDFISGYAPDPRRPATKQFDPQGSLEHWIHANSASLPVLPYYNTWGDERIAVQHCFFFWCSTGPDTSYGDVVLQPGTDVPTQDTAGGGERFLPTGYTGQSWQWNELYRVMWDPQADPYQIGALTQLVNAPQQHSNITKHQSEIPVTDCQTGQMIPVDQELAKVIAARALGTTYTCDPSTPH